MTSESDHESRGVRARRVLHIAGWVVGLPAYLLGPCFIIGGLVHQSAAAIAAGVLVGAAGYAADKAFLIAGELAELIIERLEKT